MSSSFFYSCTKTGLSEGFACAACGVEVEQEEVEALGHEYDYTKPYATKTAATCIKEGEGYFKCTREGCDDAEGSRIAHAIPMTEHKYTIETVKAPSCTQGYTEHFCETTGCKASYKDSYVDAITEHKTLDEYLTGVSKSSVKAAVEDADVTSIRLVDENGEKITKAPTKCSETCNIEYTCATCREWIRVNDYQYIPHASGATIAGSTVVATCQVEGHHYEICPKCNKEAYVKDSKKLTHAQGGNPTIEEKPTCTEGGYSHYKCTNCGEDVRIEKSETVAKGHNFVYATSTSVKNYDATKNSKLTEATCTEAGYGYCTGCNQYMSVPAKGHDMKLTQGWEAVCGPSTAKAGQKDYYTCLDPKCPNKGEFFYDEEGTETIVNSEGKAEKNESNVKTIVEIPWAHTFDAAGYTPATCTTAGSGYCTVCKKTVSEAAKGHKYGTKTDGETYFKAATCKTKGYEICKVCGDNHELAINPNAHDFDGGLYKTTTDVTCESDGKKERVCALCDHVMTSGEFAARTDEDKEKYPQTITIKALKHIITKEAAYMYAATSDAEDITADGYYFTCDNNCAHHVLADTTGAKYQDTADSSKVIYELASTYVNDAGKTVYFYIKNGKPVLYPEIKGEKKQAYGISAKKVSGGDSGTLLANSTSKIDIDCISDENTINITKKSDLTSTVNGLGATTHGFAIVLDLGISKANVVPVSGYAFASAETTSEACTAWGATGASEFIIWLAEEDFEKGPITLTFRDSTDSTGTYAPKTITVNYIS